MYMDQFKDKKKKSPIINMEPLRPTTTKLLTDFLQAWLDLRTRSFFDNLCLYPLLLGLILTKEEKNNVNDIKLHT